MKLSAFILLSLVGLCVPAFAVTDPLDVGLRKCGQVSDQTQRLACFDALTASLPKVEADRIGMTAAIDQKRRAAAANTTPPGSPVAGVNRAPPNGPATGVNTAPSNNPTTAANTAPPGNPVTAANPAPPPGGGTLTAKIVSVTENARGLLIFSLDNNQVWIQDQPSTNIRFDAGETVRIQHGALTALWLAADHGRKTRVKRIR
jgi:hypothetical protein